MFKKVMAVAALGIVAVFATPLIASAAEYNSSSNIIVYGANGVPLADVGPGDGVTIEFQTNTFIPGESVNATADGFGTVTLSTLRATPFSLSKSASSDGSAMFTMNLPSDASGTYNLSATGAESRVTGTATVTVVPSDAGAGSGSTSSNGLASTGANVPMLLIWGALGILALGGALIAVRVAVRRQRVSA